MTSSMMVVTFRGGIRESILETDVSDSLEFVFKVFGGADVGSSSKGSYD